MRWLSRLFRRRREPAPGSASPGPVDDWLPNPSSEDWKAGDLALCISGGSWINRRGEASDGPATDEVRVVTGVKRDGASAGCWLKFSRWPGKTFDASNFYKITPRADAAVRGEAASLSDLLRRPAPAPAQPEETPA